MEIKRSTPDAVLEALYKDNLEGLLLRFEAIKAVANAADTERDRLRKYIQERVPDGQHGRVILSKTPGTAVLYPNSDGRYCLEHCTIIDGLGAQEDNVVVHVYSQRLSADRLLAKLQHGKDQLQNILDALHLGSGTTIVNAQLYTYSEPLKINAVVLPEEAHDREEG